MASRGQSITIAYYAYDTTNKVGKTGDVANHTLRWVKNGTSAAPTNAAAEVDATNVPGLYKLVLTGTETTADFGTLGGKSSTAGVVIQPVAVSFEQLPTAAPAASGGLPTADASNRVLANAVQIAGSTTAATNQAAAALALYTGTVTGSPTTTSFRDTALSGNPNFIKGRVVAFRSGAINLEASTIATFDPATHEITVNLLQPFTQAPAIGDSYDIL